MFFNGWRRLPAGWLMAAGILAACTDGQSGRHTGKSQAAGPVAPADQAEPAEEQSADAAVPKPTSTTTSEADGTDKARPRPVAGENLYNALYRFEIRATSFGFPVDVCSGQVRARVRAGITMAEFPLEIPEGLLSCYDGALTIDLDEIFTGGTGSGASRPRQDPQLSVKDGVIRQGAQGDFRFEPARPLSPAVLRLSRDDLRDLNVSETITIEDRANQVTDQGRISVRVTGVGPMTLPGTGVALKDAVSWETLTDSGFTKTDRVAGGLMDRVAMTLGFQPVTVGRIEVSGGYRSLLKIDPDADQDWVTSIVDIFSQAHTFEVTLELMEMEGLTGNAL